MQNRASIIKAATFYDSTIIGPAGKIVKNHVGIELEKQCWYAKHPPGSSASLNIKLFDRAVWLSIFGMFFFFIGEGTYAVFLKASLKKKN